MRCRLRSHILCHQTRFHVVLIESQPNPIRNRVTAKSKLMAKVSMKGHLKYRSPLTLWPEFAVRIHAAELGLLNWLGSAAEKVEDTGNVFVGQLILWRHQNCHELNFAAFLLTIGAIGKRHLERLTMRPGVSVLISAATNRFSCEENLKARTKRQRPKWSTRRKGS